MVPPSGSRNLSHRSSHQTPSSYSTNLTSSPPQIQRRWNHTMKICGLRVLAPVTVLSLSLTTLRRHCRRGMAALSTFVPPKSYPDDISRYDLLEDTNTRAPIITHARHRTHLESALRFLEAFLETCELPFSPSKSSLTTMCSCRRCSLRSRRAPLCITGYRESVWLD